MADSTTTLTTAAGAPVGDNQNSLTAGPHGPILLQDVHLVEKLAHFNRERIPERVVHAKGAGAYGYFEVTHDVTHLTAARFLSSVGKRTEAFVRFSTVAGERGAADADRDPRGFALKLYTEDGNYDLVMNNLPIFFLRDPIKFPDFIHSQKRHPETNVRDPNAIWDFFSLNPETLHMMTMVFSDRGTPRTLRHMDGFGGHTFQWINPAGEAVWVRYHFKTEQGIQNLTRDEAIRTCGEDPDHATRDLFDAITRGDHPAWRVAVQVMPLADVASRRYDPFDLTKVWPHSEYPRLPVGRLVLDRNPRNYFAEVEQAAFSPGNVVPGVDFSPDRMLQGRIFAYADAHRYRLGVNHGSLPVNAPHAATARTYHRDVYMRADNGGPAVNYQPNSLGGPAEGPTGSAGTMPIDGPVGRYDHRAGHDDYTQAGDLYRLLTPDARARLVENIVAALGKARREYQVRQVAHFRAADREYGDRVAAALGVE